MCTLDLLVCFKNLSKILTKDVGRDVTRGGKRDTAVVVAQLPADVDVQLVVQWGQLVKQTPDIVLKVRVLVPGAVVGAHVSVSTCLKMDNILRIVCLL